jgi:hypothetical protein
MKSRRAERRDRAAFVGRKCLEPPRIDPTVDCIEITADLDCPHATIGLAQHLAVRWDEAIELTRSVPGANLLLNAAVARASR